MDDGICFPAELAFAGKCDLLVDGGSAVITGGDHTINLRIEVFDYSVIPKLSLVQFLPLQWPGYDGWGAQVSAASPADERID